MEKLVFDNGLKEYEVNGHILRFNPSDPNVYSRFVRAIEEIRDIESEYSRKAAEAGATKDKQSFGSLMLQQMEEMDQKIKDILSNVFGKRNDFHSIFDGVNIAAKNTHGERVIDAFIVAVKPIIFDGMTALFAKDDADIERYAGEYK